MDLIRIYMINDLKVIGPQATLPRRVAASATRFEVGEPLISDATLGTGTATSNVYVLAAADFVNAGTNYFGGIAIKRALPLKTGTLIAQTVMTTNPIAYAGRLRGQAEVSGSIDTAAELLALIGNVTRVDYNVSGAPDGTQLYTIKDVEAADADLFQVLEGNISLGSLDVLVDHHAYRIDNDYS